MTDKINQDHKPETKNNNLSFTNEDLLECISIIETGSYEPVKYYSIYNVDDNNPLYGLFFTAKTPCGAILRIYQYMQDKKIPVWMGVKKGQEIKDLIGCQESITNPFRFMKLCEEWAQEYMVCFNKIMLV